MMSRKRAGWSKEAGQVEKVGEKESLVKAMEPQTIGDAEIDAMISESPRGVAGKKNRKKKRASIASNPSVNPTARKTVLVDGLHVAAGRVHPSIEEEIRTKGVKLAPGIRPESLEIPSYHSIVASGLHPMESVFFQEAFQKKLEKKEAKLKKKGATGIVSGVEVPDKRKERGPENKAAKKSDKPEKSSKVERIGKPGKPAKSEKPDKSEKKHDRDKGTPDRKRFRDKPEVSREVPQEVVREQPVETLSPLELLRQQERALQAVIAQVQKTLQDVRESLKTAAEVPASDPSGKLEKDLKKQENRLKDQERKLQKEARRSHEQTAAAEKAEPEKKPEKKPTPKPESGKVEEKSVGKKGSVPPAVEKKPEKPRRPEKSQKPRAKENVPAEKPTSAPDRQQKKNLLKSPFAQMGLSMEMLRALDDAQYIHPSPIQAALIPVAMTGEDVMGQAQTGTGKTAAFAIPILETVQFDDDCFDPQALVLLPTRELAVQVRDEFEKLAKYSDLETIALYGGKPLPPQVQQLKEGVDVVIGTPGRVMDHIKRRSLKLDRLKIVVLDEADRMLDIGFRPDIEKILRMAPQSRQTLLLSATLPPPVEHLARKYMREPKVLNCSPTDIASETIEQFYFTVDPERKFELLQKLLEREQPHQAIIFCRTKRGTEKIGMRLSKVISGVQCIHGDLQQRKRDSVMRSFREGKTRFLVATDVVGRGIDVSGISHIINYDIPKFCDDYVHRVGRTGRMGHEGVAFTFVAPEEGNELTRIEMRINKLLKRDEMEGFKVVKPVETAAEPEEDPMLKRIRRAL